MWVWWGDVNAARGRPGQTPPCTRACLDYTGQAHITTNPAIKIVVTFSGVTVILGHSEGGNLTLCRFVEQLTMLLAGWHSLCVSHDSRVQTRMGLLNHSINTSYL